MKHLFIPYELVVIAKEKGFNEPCFAYYDYQKCLTFMQQDEGDRFQGFNNSDYDSAGTYCAPIYQQIVDWLREKKDLTINIIGHSGMGFEYCISRKTQVALALCDLSCKTYYEALNKAIEEAFKLI